jgi:hypothetical protein
VCCTNSCLSSTGHSRCLSSMPKFFLTKSKYIKKHRKQKEALRMNNSGMQQQHGICIFHLENKNLLLPSKNSKINNMVQVMLNFREHIILTSHLSAQPKNSSFIVLESCFIVIRLFHSFKATRFHSHLSAPSKNYSYHVSKQTHV